MMIALVIWICIQIIFLILVIGFIGYLIKKRLKEREEEYETLHRDDI